MSFWKKKPEHETAIGPVAQPVSAPPKAKLSPPVELFSTQSRQEIRKLFEIGAEAPVDAEKALDRFGKLRSALGNGTVIQGRLTFDTPVRIDGKLTGEIFSSAALIVGPSGVVDATVEVSTLIVLGSVKGVVKATDRVEVYAGGTLEGSVVTPVFIMERGCTFSGDCKMPQKEAAPKSVQPVVQKGPEAASPMQKPSAGPIVSAKQR